MKQNIIILISAAFIIAMAGSSMAEDMSHDMGHGMKMKGTGHEGHQMEASGHDGMDHSGHMGELIHEGSTDGYQFAYHLMDIREKMAAMKAEGHAMGGMNATHHLMVHVQDPKGAPVESAKVGYQVKGPDGTKQKLMSMGMGSGYGSDVNLGPSGEYTIKTKVVVGGKSLIDEFNYTIK